MAFSRANLPAAHHLVEQYLVTQPNDEEGWLLLSQIVERAEDRAWCLRRVLAINPNNRLALAGLLPGGRRTAPHRPLMRRRPAGQTG